MDDAVEDRITRHIDTRFSAFEQVLDTKISALSDAIHHGDAQAAQAVAGLRALHEQNAAAVDEIRRHSHKQGERIGTIHGEVNDLRRDVVDLAHKAKARDIVIDHEREQRVENTEWRKDIRRDMGRFVAAVKWLGPVYTAGLVAALIKLYGG